MTFVSALRHDGMMALMLIEGPMNGELFLAYVEQCLAPMLKPNDIVAVDNLAPIKLPASRRRSRPLAQRFATRRSTRQISIRSRCPSANSKPTCASSHSVPSRASAAIRSFLSSVKGQEFANYLRHAGYVSIWPGTALIPRNLHSASPIQKTLVCNSPLEENAL
jgi:hypothetical protein